MKGQSQTILFFHHLPLLKSFHQDTQPAKIALKRKKSGEHQTSSAHSYTGRTSSPYLSSTQNLRSPPAQSAQIFVVIFPGIKTCENHTKREHTGTTPPPARTQNSGNTPGEVTTRKATHHALKQKTKHQNKKELQNFENKQKHVKQRRKP